MGEAFQTQGLGRHTDPHPVQQPELTDDFKPTFKVSVSFPRGHSKSYENGEGQVA
jgi:hypothetical protein